MIEGETMPTSTFFHLPKEKQDIILNAAKDEFTKVSFTEASINQIIQKCHISRGSFYMYFQDKEDLYQYLVQTHQKHLEKRYIEILETHGGDLFETYLDLFQTITKKMSTDKEKNFFKRIIMNMTLKNKTCVLTDIFEKIDWTYLNIKTKQELHDVIDCIHVLLIHALIHFLTSNLTEQEVYDTFYRQLSILKEGLYKEEKND